jgi:putative glutamine amidotransferase
VRNTIAGMVRPDTREQAAAAHDSPPPRIGVTMYREDARWGVWQESADLLPAHYSAAVLAAGGVPLLLPAGGHQLPGSVDATVTALDGLVVAGGADVAPERYGAARHELTGRSRPDRDSWELALIRGALERDLPVLGVCRGMQVLAVALGGTLVQHLPDVVGHQGHCPTEGTFGQHLIRTAEGSVLAGLVGPAADVSTHHHQAVERLPAGAIATAWAEDGTVEAIELAGPSEDSFIVGVQWHPEVRRPGDGGDALFAGFVSHCAQRRGQPAGRAISAPEGAR